jgi:hypothetical protein
MNIRAGDGGVGALNRIESRIFTVNSINGFSSEEGLRSKFGERQRRGNKS